MSNKSNDDKLRILQERLAQIQEKQDTASAKRDGIANENKAKNTQVKATQKKGNPRLFKLFKVFFFSFCIAFGVKYAYNNISKSKQEHNISEIEKVKENFNYNLDIKGDNIAIISTFNDEESAKATTNNLKVKGFKADYFYLPNKSNSTEKVYKVFIGPYENKEETNQWAENLESDYEIILL